MPISGVGVAVATLGGVLVYAGMRGTSPLAALRDMTSGQTPGAVGTDPLAPDPLDSSTWASTIGGAPGGVGAGHFAALAQSALVFSHDRYSKARRWENGYSDCSSFVGKAFRQIGITPPGASTTTEYLVWRKLKKISASEVGAGDLLCTLTHMAVAMSPTTAIGQQNPSRNVVVGPIGDIMYGMGAVTYLRYVGSAAPIYGPLPYSPRRK